MTRKYRQKVKCSFCNHIFKTRTRALLVTCSYCGRKFNRSKNLIGPGE